MNHWMKRSYSKHTYWRLRVARPQVGPLHALSLYVLMESDDRSARQLNRFTRGKRPQSDRLLNNHTLTAGGRVNESVVRILLVDDYTLWSDFLCSVLQCRAEFHIVGVVSGGLQAIQTARELQPDLILLDIGLPQLNGIEAARKITDAAPKSKLLFVSENQDPEIVLEALRTGAQGYVLKSRVARELFDAIDAVIRDGTFVSESCSPLRD